MRILNKIPFGYLSVTLGVSLAKSFVTYSVTLVTL